MASRPPARASSSRSRQRNHEPARGDELRGAGARTGRLRKGPDRRVGLGEEGRHAELAGREQRLRRAGMDARRQGELGSTAAQSGPGPERLRRAEVEAAMRSMIRSMALAAAALTLAGAAPAQGDAARKDDSIPATALPAAAASGAGVAVMAEPRADETNAQRAKTQPGNNAPFWRAVRNSGNAPGSVNNMAAPGERGVLVQAFTEYPGSKMTNAGEAWRQVRNHWIIPYGGALLLIVLVAMALYYFAKGPLGGHEPDTGRKIERFTYFERAAHWSNAIAFCVLAISGLVMAFG